MIDDPTKVIRLDLSDPNDLATLDGLDYMKWVKAGTQSLAGPDKKVSVLSFIHPVTKKKETVDSIDRPEIQRLISLGYEEGTATADVKKPKLSPASQILADPSLRMPYKNNSASPEDKALFEQAIIEFTSGGQVFNFETGRYEKVAAKQLTPDLRETLKEGNPKLFTQITGVSLDSSGKEVVRNLMTANIELINPDGTLNTKSPIWDTTAPNRFDPEINYKLAIGGSRILPSAVGAVTEIGQEFLGMDASPETIKFKKAQKSLNGLANDLLQYATGDQEGRVLKFVQELIEAETSDIRPGGLLFKTDADAKGALDNLADGLKQAFQINAAKLPEYTPDAANRYSAAIIQSTSQDQQKLKVLLNEVLKFQAFFASGLPTTGAGTAANKKSLIQMAQ
tara:strand:- start:134 stop:1318 length:1185 start_codon:yes stop_codon:yes gene_type:complete